MSDSKRCKSCGNPVDPEVAREHDGACPWCLAVFTFSPEPVGNPATAAKSAPTQFGKYLRTEKLGAGGMGEVWKAFDTELNRWVALKFLKDEDPAVVARFQREAKTAASLSHPHIAAIHEVGEIDGRHYIAMQYVDGRTMGTFPRQDRRLIVQLFRDAARAIDHAHRHRIIHRDLKPENLMIEESAEGCSVMVLDFGLARPIEGGEKLSQSGEVYGTAPYMSPEQARGEHLDERADVYALGATMYEVLAGRAPFSGTNLLEVIRKVGHEEPVRPRKHNPQLHRDLETIVLKCLEKSRDRRYANARELAEDLERFLDHDPIHARPPSTLYRLRMKLAKRRAVVATAAIASAALAGALGWWLLVGAPAAEHHRLMAAGMKSWHEARVSAIAGGDAGDIRAKARAAREQFDGAMRARESAESQVMRARCLELEGKDDEALSSLERAHSLDAGNVDARLELAKALFLKYQDSRGTPMVVHRSRKPGEKPDVFIGALSGENEEERRWRERGERILAEGEAPPAQANLLKGLLAMGKGDYARASAALESYSKAERWDVQALTLQGICLYHAKNFEGAIAALDRSLGRVPRAEGFFWRGNAKEDLGLPLDAIADQTRAIELDPHHVRARVSRGRVKAGLRLFDEAIADLTSAIELDPRFTRAYIGRGVAKSGKGLYDEAVADYLKAIELDSKCTLAYTNIGYEKATLGLLDEAIANYTKSIELDPRYPPALYHRGIAKARKGLRDEAIADYTRAIEVDPRFEFTYCNRGYLLAQKGLHDAAIEDFTKALELDPTSAPHHTQRGRSKSAKGLHAQAIEDFTKAIELDPKYAMAYHNRALTEAALNHLDESIADCTKALELDPKMAVALVTRGSAKVDKNLLDEAIADYTRAIELDPEEVTAWNNRGIVKNTRGLYDEAIADFSKALELDPKHSAVHANRGIAKELKGDPEGAIADYQKALDLDPKSAAAWHNLGKLRSAKGLHVEAIADFTKAIEVDPRLTSAYTNRGLAKDRTGDFDGAIADYTKALELDPKDAKTCSNRAVAKEAKGDAVGAVADFTKAIELEPKNAAIWFNRGSFHLAKGRHDEAIADFSKAIELDPSYVVAIINRGIAKSYRGLHDEAIADYTKAIEIDPKNSSAYSNRGVEQTVKRLYDEAIADCAKAIELDPRNAVAWYSRGNARNAKGLREEAIADYTKSIELNPKAALTYLGRASAKRSMGLWSDAKEDWKKALEVAPPDWPYRASIERLLAAPAEAVLYGEGSRLHQSKNYREAIAKFKAVVEGHPDSREALGSAYNIACGHALLGEKKDALTWLEKSVEMGWSDLEHLEKDSDLDSLRKEERYLKLVQRLKAK